VRRPMQNPMIPVFPVQSARAARKLRAASNAVNAGPDLAWIWRNAPRTQRIHDLPSNRSGASARYPRAANWSAFCLMSAFSPNAS